MPIQPAYFGLSGIDLEDASIDLGHGVLLTRTYAHLMAPYIMAFAPALPGRPHPGPWKAALAVPGSMSRRSSWCPGRLLWRLTHRSGSPG